MQTHEPKQSAGPRRNTRRLFVLAGAAAAALLLAGCATPAYVDKGSAKPMDDTATFNPVVYEVTDAFRQAPPKCVAVLPFQAASPDAIGGMAPFEPASGPAALDQIYANGMEIDMTLAATPGGVVDPAPEDQPPSVALTPEERVERVRRAFYAQLSPQPLRDIELDTIDEVLAGLPANQRDDLATLGQRLGCDTLMLGTVTDYSAGYYGLYSRVSVGAAVKLVRAADGAVLWEGQHIAQSHGGAVPLSPVGAVIGLVSAVNNVQGEQIFRVTDDLARRLVSTIPDRDQLMRDSLMNVASGPAEPIADSAAVSADDNFRVVTANRLNLRSGPGRGFQVQAKLDRDDQVEVVGKPLRGDWLPVKTAQGRIGYVSLQYISAGPATNTAGTSK